MAYRSCLENSRPVTGSAGSNPASSATESCRSGRTELTANQLIELLDPWVRIPDSPPRGALDRYGDGADCKSVASGPQSSIL